MDKDPPVEVEFDAEQPRESDLASITTLAEQALKEEAECVRLTNELHDALARYRSIVDDQLPAAMATVRMTEFKMEDGKRVKVNRSFIGNKLTNEEGLAYVEANEGGDSIKTCIMLELPKGELETAKRILNVLRADQAANRFVSLKLERYVHQSTIASFAKSQVEAGKAPPFDKIGVVQKTTAQIGGSRTKTVELKGFDYK